MVCSIFLYLKFNQERKKTKRKKIRYTSKTDKKQIKFPLLMINKRLNELFLMRFRVFNTLKLSKVLNYMLF